MIIVYATSDTSYFCSISLRGEIPLILIVYCSIAATSQIRNCRVVVLNPFAMLSTLHLWIAIGLLITWVEASPDHCMQLIQISASSYAANRLKLFTVHTPQSTILQKAVLRLVHLSRSIPLRSITVMPQSKARLQSRCHRQ